MAPHDVLNRWGSTTKPPLSWGLCHWSSQSTLLFTRPREQKDVRPTTPGSNPERPRRRLRLSRRGQPSTPGPSQSRWPFHSRSWLATPPVPEGAGASTLLGPKRPQWGEPSLKGAGVYSIHYILYIYFIYIYIYTYPRLPKHTANHPWDWNSYIH